MARSKCKNRKSNRIYLIFLVIIVIITLCLLLLFLDIPWGGFKYEPYKGINGY